MTDYVVKITVKNGRLIRKIKEAGYTSQKAFADAFGINSNRLNALINMRSKAFTKNGEWREIAWDISSALHCEPEELFNEQQRYRALQRNTGEVYMDEEQIQQLMIASPEQSTWAKLEVKRLLDAIPNEQNRLVVEDRFLDNAMLDEIALKLVLAEKELGNGNVKACGG